MIKHLPTYLINKIKAGEVIDRPSSIVKELMENAIDSGATKIVVSIRNGGKDLIKIEDNGNGINFGELPLAIERYATSKLFDENDLYDIHSYGFRGEALSSISEISKFVLQSKVSGSQAGQISKIDNLVETKNISYHQEKGTTILVQDIFFNTPARQKFLKSAQTEWGYIYDVFLNYALSHPEIEFALIKDDKIIFSLQPSNFENRIFSIFPSAWKSNIGRFEFENEDFKIFGYNSNAGLSFFDQDKIFIFVNSRPVKDKIIKKSLMQSYYSNIAKGKYPFVVLFLETEAKNLDVNIHPKKQEIKFLEPQKIFGLVANTISENFKKNQISNIDIEKFGNFEQKNSSEKKSEIFETKNNNFQNSFGRGNIQNNFSNSFKAQFANQIEQKFENQKNQFSQNDALELEFEADIVSNENLETGEYKIFGQLWNMYIVLQHQQNLYLIDQHALAERILYEKLLKQFEENLGQSESLLYPISLELFGDESKLEILKNLGFEIEYFGNQKYILTAVPKVLASYKFDMNNILELDEVNTRKILDYMFATKACKAAIKAGDRLSLLELESLVKDGFENIEGFFVCQHGRPFFWQIDKSQIDKLFDR